MYFRNRTLVRRPSRKWRTFAHTLRASLLLQPIIGFWCSVDVEKLPHAGVRQVVSAEIAVAMAVLIENPADCEVRGTGL